MWQPGLGSLSAFLVMNVLSAFAARFFCLAFIFSNGQKLIMYISCVVTEPTVVYRSKILWSRNAFKKISVHMCTSCIAVTHRPQTCRHSSVNSSINVS